MFFMLGTRWRNAEGERDGKKAKGSRRATAKAGVAVVEVGSRLAELGQDGVDRGKRGVDLFSELWGMEEMALEW